MSAVRKRPAASRVRKRPAARQDPAEEADPISQGDPFNFAELGGHLCERDEQGVRRPRRWKSGLLRAAAAQAASAPEGAEQDAGAGDRPFGSGGWRPPWTAPEIAGDGRPAEEAQPAAGSTECSAGAAAASDAMPRDVRCDAPRKAARRTRSPMPGLQYEGFLAEFPFTASELGRRLVWSPRGQYAFGQSMATWDPSVGPPCTTRAIGIIYLEGSGLHPLPPRRGWEGNCRFTEVMCGSCYRYFTIFCLTCGMATCRAGCHRSYPTSCDHHWERAYPPRHRFLRPPGGPRDGSPWLSSVPFQESRYFFPGEERVEAESHSPARVGSARPVEGRRGG